MTEQSPVVPSVGAVPVEVPSPLPSFSHSDSCDRYYADEADLTVACTCGATKAQAWLDQMVAEREAIIEAIRDAVPLALPSNYDDLPRCVRGLAMQRDNQHELKDHLAEVARRLTEDRAKAHPLIAARVRADGKAERDAELSRWIEVGQRLEAEKRLAEAECAEYHRRWQEAASNWRAAEQAAERALARVRAEERQRIADALASHGARLQSDPRVLRGLMSVGHAVAVALAGGCACELRPVAAGSAAPVATPEHDARCERAYGQDWCFCQRRADVDFSHTATGPVATPEMHLADGEYVKVFHQHEDGGEAEGRVRECCEPGGPVATPERPEIVVLCGSTRFKDAFREAAKSEALAGRIVLTVSDLDPRPEMRHVNVPIDADTKARLDELHRRKIDLADRVLVLNVGGYIGESTRSEIVYATAHGKPITYLEEAHRMEDCIDPGACWYQPHRFGVCPRPEQDGQR